MLQMNYFSSFNDKFLTYLLIYYYIFNSCNMIYLWNKQLCWDETQDTCQRMTGVEEDKNGKVDWTEIWKDLPVLLRSLYFIKCNKKSSENY